MNEPISNTMPEPKKVAVWAEGTHIEAKEFVIPKKSPDSSDDIPTIPDLDDFQDILEISMAPVPERKNTETVNALSEVHGGGAIAGIADSMETVLEILISLLPREEVDEADSVWTVDSLLAQLAEEYQDIM